MIIEKVKLKDIYKNLKSGEDRGVLTCYLHEESPEIPIKARPAILVIPGGGYGMVSDREGEPVAMEFFIESFNVFVLNYSVAPVCYPVQFTESSAAMDYIRNNSKKFGIIKDKVAVIGFSAGGHLAGSTAVFSSAEVLKDYIPNIEKNPTMPNAAILAYPVISSTEYPHQGSFINVTSNGKKIDPKELSLEKHIPDNMCPCYLWHTAADNAVDVRNSLCFASALKEKNVPFSLHVFEEGNHGLSTANEEVTDDSCPSDIRQWVGDAIAWLKDKRNFRTIKK